MNRKERREFMRQVRRYYVTTPLSIVNRLMGLEAFTDPLSFPAGTTIGGGNVGNNIPILIPAATTTYALTLATNSGKTMVIQSTGGLAFSFPAAAGTGASFDFIVGTTVSGGSVTWDGKTNSDIFVGFQYNFLSGTGMTVFRTAIAATFSNLCTWNGSTTGGSFGDTFMMKDIAANTWAVFCRNTGTGSIATMFSAH